MYVMDWTGRWQALRLPIRSDDCRIDNSAHRLIVPVPEAADGRVDPRNRIDTLKSDPEADLVCQALEERPQRASVTLPEWVNRVEFTDMLGGSPDKLLADGQAGAALGLDRCEPLSHLVGDIRNQAEHVTALGDVHRAVFASPLINILKNVAM